MYIVTKVSFWTTCTCIYSHEICVDDLSGHSFRDLAKKRGYHGPSRWFSMPPSVSKHFKQNRDELSAPVRFTIQRGRRVIR